MSWLILGPLVFLAAAVAYVSFQRFAGRIQSQFEHITGVAANNPYCARLEPMEHGEWDDEEAVKDATRQLRAEGFKRVGDFITQPEFRFLRVLCDPTRSVYAVLQEETEQGLTVELFTPYADGAFVTVTNAAAHAWPDAPTQPVIRSPGTGATDLLGRLLRERPAQGMQPASPEEFATTYLRKRRQFMAWMLERGGPTDEEIRQELNGFPVGAIKKMTLDITRAQWQTAMNSALQDQVREQFVAQAGAAAAA